jgi:hypothetical protein
VEVSDLKPPGRQEAHYITKHSQGAKRKPLLTLLGLDLTELDSTPQSANRCWRGMLGVNISVQSRAPPEKKKEKSGWAEWRNDDHHTKSIRGREWWQRRRDLTWLGLAWSCADAPWVCDGAQEPALCVFPGTLPRLVQRALLGFGRPGVWSVGRLIVCRGLERTQVKSSQVKSSQVKSSQVKSSQVKSSQVKSSQVKSSQVKSSQERTLASKMWQAPTVTTLAGSWISHFPGR